MITWTIRPPGSPGEHGPHPSRESFFSSSFFSKEMSEFVLPAEEQFSWSWAWEITSPHSRDRCDLLHVSSLTRKANGQERYFTSFLAFVFPEVIQHTQWPLAVKQCLQPSQSRVSHRQQAWAGSAGQHGIPLSSSSKGKCSRKPGTLIPLFLCASLTYPISSLCDYILKHKCAFTVQPATKEEQH